MGGARGRAWGAVSRWRQHGTARTGAQGDVVWVPTEDVLLLSVDLPAMTAAQRRAAMPFAVEEHLAQPLDAVQVVTGPQGADGRWLVAVVARAVIAGARGAGPGRLAPDVFQLPAPATGWAVAEAGGRMLVRAANGTGFACPAEVLPVYWQAAGKPGIVLHAGQLPAPVVAVAVGPLPPPDAALSRFDLRAGMAEAGARALPRGLLRVAAVLAVAACGHLALLMADVAALDRLVAAREEDLRAVLAAAGRPVAGDLDAALAGALAARGQGPGGGFLPVLTQLAAALVPQAGQVTLQDLRWSAAPPTLAATFEAGDLATLQDAEARLAEAGLTVRAGAASSADGRAEVAMEVSGDRSGRGVP